MYNNSFREIFNSVLSGDITESVFNIKFVPTDPLEYSFREYSFKQQSNSYPEAYKIILDTHPDIKHLFNTDKGKFILINKHGADLMNKYSKDIQNRFADID